ncbi:hypothetical protein [Roseixanthobacter glucoisosaccharinicivorans]|uniref:hypothetical protein n=1 Tax=Roseixanthobacter glucoisosaccharinicivorans TaxID=3119923 RepID=UPI00372C5179
MRLGISLNGVIIPGRSIEGVLARHALSLVIYNEGDETFKVSLPGSATAIHYRGHHLLLVAQHQLKGVDESRVGMLTDDGSRVITSSGRRGYHPTSESDANDVVAFNFTDPVANIPELKPRFFDLTTIPAHLKADITLAALIVGFPSAVQDYDLYENNRLGFYRLHVACLPHEEQPTDKALLRVTPTRALEISPDGMSGGPAFVIQDAEGGPRAFFAGIVLRAGREDFYVLKSGAIVAFLDSVLPW